MRSHQWFLVVVLASCSNDEALQRIEQRLELRLAEQQEIAANLAFHTARLAELEGRFAVASAELAALGLDGGALTRPAWSPAAVPPPSAWEFRAQRDRRARIAALEAEVDRLQKANGRVGTDINWTTKQVEDALNRLSEARRRH